ncbi:retrotransposable element ORF2 protein [Nymphaea thermarum]|nr:retrotransposable element ORF2 protein [Nymphaea thermarum]
MLAVKSSQGVAVGDKASFGSVGRRGLPQPPSWADRVAGRGSARQEDLPPLKVILVGGRVLVAARWSPGQPLEINPSTTAPLWVRLPSLPPYFWNGRIFKAAAMGLQGDFLEADIPTVQMSRSNFARILLDLPIQSELPPEVEIDLGGGPILAQATVYEGRLRFCRMCGVNFHPPEKRPKILNSNVKDDFRTSEAGHMVTGISLNRGNGPSSGSRLEHISAANRFEVFAETEEDHGPHDQIKEWPEKLLQKLEQEGSAPLRAPRGKKGKNKSPNSVKDQNNNHISTERHPNHFASKPPDVQDFPYDVPPGFSFSSPSQPGQDRVASSSSKLGATKGSSSQTFRLSRDAKHISRGRRSRMSKGRNIVKDTSIFNLLLHEDLEGVGNKPKRTCYENFSPDFVLNPQVQPLESPMGETKEDPKRTFTWTNNRKNGETIFYRLDWCLLSSAWHQQWSERNQLKVVIRSSSDHSPLVFSSSFSDIGHTHPRLFRFFSSWARLPKSHRIVAEAWSRRDMGCPLIRVISKLERVRKDLSRWYKHQVGDVALRINGLKQSLEDTQIRCEAGDSSVASVEMLLRQELSTALLEEQSQWRQNARIKWLREGDAHEVVHALQPSKRPSCYLKLDLSKAYDLVNWKFLENTLLKVGFSEAWVAHVMSCVTSASALVLVNEVQGEYFYLARGLCQRDPLSPYLFIVIMEIFSRAIFGRMADRLIRPPLIPRVGRAPWFLAFEDDVFLFSDISHVSIEQVQETLRLLATNVGLKVNSHKSNIYFSDVVSDEVKDRICATLGWPCDALPTSYLGLPLFAGKLKDEWCQPLINKVEKQLSLWKSATLSYAGRLCLLKHVLSSVIGFWTSFFALPKKVYGLLAASMAKFLWGGDGNSRARHLIAWDQVCKPYSEGGV